MRRYAAIQDRGGAYWEDGNGYGDGDLAYTGWGRSDRGDGGYLTVPTAEWALGDDVDLAYEDDPDDDCGDA